tara:strand:+ start:417 stop:686 length:270 start_codon:yes stop_codon:yes gene_type:complete
MPGGSKAGGGLKTKKSVFYKMKGWGGYQNSPINQNEELESPTLSPDQERLLLKMEKDMARQRNITLDEAKQDTKIQDYLTNYRNKLLKK